MKALIIGGSGSGKSEYAESLTTKAGARPLYVATMRPFEDEARERIARHIEMRRGKGFKSVDCYTDIKNILHEKADAVLIECLSNLVANEMFSSNGDPYGIKEGLTLILDHYPHVVIVSNDVFRDGDCYSEETLEYRKQIGDLNNYLAKRCDVVVEVVAGIPIIQKGGKILE